MSEIKKEVNQKIGLKKSNSSNINATAQKKQPTMYGITYEKNGLDEKSQKSLIPSYSEAKFNIGMQKNMSGNQSSSSSAILRKGRSIQ